VVIGRTPTPTFNLNLHSDRILLEDILAWKLAHNQGERSEAPSFKFNYKVQFDIGTFSRGAFTASGLHGKARSDGADIVVSDLHFNSADGTVDGQFRWSPQGDKSILSTSGNMRKVEINQLFAGFDNFGQADLTSENIYGIADVDFNLSIHFDENTQPVISTLESETSFRIVN